MRITNANVRVIDIPFVMAFNHSLASRKATQCLILEIITDSNTRGYGECTPREYVSGETLESTVEGLKECWTKLQATTFQDVGQIRRFLDELGADPAVSGRKLLNVRCALELALLDAFAREQAIAVGELFGGLRTDTVQYSGVLSLDRSEHFPRLVERVKAFGFRQVKVKVGKETDRDLDYVEQVRSRLGADVEIRLDANGAWSLSDALSNIERYRQIGISAFEQPLPVESMLDYPHLINKISPGVNIVIDESLITIADAQWFIRHRGASGFNLKISKHGGLFNSMEILRIADRAGIKCQLGCHVGETSILTSAGMILAGLWGNMFAHEGAFGSFLLSWDVVKCPLQFGNAGKAFLPALMDGPGLGISIDSALLEKSTAAMVNLPYGPQKL